MPQLLLPLIPEGSTIISDLVSVYRRDERLTYYIGMHPIYSHRADDLRMFRITTAQLITSDACRHTDILNTFGVSKSSVNRSLKTLREKGIEGFFKKRRGGRRGHVLTPEVIKKAQHLLDQGIPAHETADELCVRRDTLSKAIKSGRLRESKSGESLSLATDKSTRSESDAIAGNAMGIGCTRVVERVMSSLGKCEAADMQFEACIDVPNAGVLCALPALLATGVLEGIELLLGKIKGYYSAVHVLLLLAFMTLCRIKTVEQLRGHSPGEFGKLIGLDRIPEVRCLREKMDALSTDDRAEKWAIHLSRYWMEANTEKFGTLYIDGHVRVYNGQLTKLPRRYVSRERLCLRGTTDYWVNDAIGQPFFKVEKPVDPGLLKTLGKDIVPRLLNDIAHQPTMEELRSAPLLSRFILVFDREGYSPTFFQKMWVNHRVSCITYHKFPGDLWPAHWFTEQVATMPGGEVVSMKLAEMGICFGSGKNSFWMREIRKLTESGHQSSIISTAYALAHTQLAVRMFSRWCQENFFRYMMQHFEIDLLQEYGVEEFSDTETVVNPLWRELERSRNSLQNKLRYRRSRFAQITMHPQNEDNTDRYRKWINQKSELLEEIEQQEHQYEALKKKIKQTPKHINWGQLEQKDRFHKLLPGRKRLMDTIRMIAYRAETSMSKLLIGPTVDTPAARKLLQELFRTEADILPEPENKLLRIRVHSASRPAANRIINDLFHQLNYAEMKYPGTDMQIVYELIGSNM